MTGAEAWWWPYVMIVVAGWLATDIWRWLGVLASGRLREDSEVMIFVRAVATALVAGVIAKLILFPAGALQTTPMALRILAAACGFAAFFASRQKVVVGVAVGEVVLIGGWLLLGLG
ncbi:MULTISPECIES: AzlD domain-containing protein [unclassified Stappia]|uniref:AzlD domain-containing protein n=1 Tax=unclassified Stappia TaxID=2629676 RepID=UPI001643ADFE|nr:MULTISPECIES: AzlD domain-containing protein [unclassified Stappia]